MIEMKIDWLDECPKCGCSEHVVKTEKGCGTWLFDGDAVSCGKCGHTGEIETEDHTAWVEWNKIEFNEPEDSLSKNLPFDVVQSLKEVS